MSGNRDKIIKILSKSDRFVTADELTKSIGISPKTIYRAVNGINDHYDEPIIVSERGKGLKLNYDRYLELTKQTGSENDKLDSSHWSDGTRFLPSCCSTRLWPIECQRCMRTSS